MAEEPFALKISGEFSGRSAHIVYRGTARARQRPGPHPDPLPVGEGTGGVRRKRLCVNGTKLMLRQRIVADTLCVPSVPWSSSAGALPKEPLADGTRRVPATLDGTRSVGRYCRGGKLGSPGDERRKMKSWARNGARLTAASGNYGGLCRISCLLPPIRCRDS